MDGDFFSFERLVAYFPKILSKFPVSLYVVAVSTALALALGTVLAIIRIRKIPVLHQLAVVYISFVRGTPILIHLFLVYYGLPLLFNALFGYNIASGWNKLIFVFLAYGINEAGFLAEHIRAAILSVSRGQTEAGHMVGLTGFQTFRRIVLPQAFRVLVPGLSAMVVGMLPATALAYLLGVTDMMGMITTISYSSQHSLEGYADAAIIFIAASFILEKLSAMLIKKLSYGRKSVDEAT
ncbi:amino acid ABC transporter permease [Cohnella hashimotonis]|uniref:Amino acid ABC transporter permease n=1 Tax=Cohnella hashimotonis TaxID=2826895 RepID=A0ABT6TJJ2_9BACL|nr:amino acid ABC transporter permease [Cohnella hashimotonis]MDI4647012.1 amino acid ABC transporter permease [Cohnella hashimotonis]